MVEGLGPSVDGLTEGAEVFALADFERDGVAADYAIVPAELLAPKPGALSHVEAAAVPLPALSAWQALFDHGGLAAGQRVLIHGAAGGVGEFATQLAHEHGAYVIGTTSQVDRARELKADEAIDDSATPFEDAIDPVDLVFDTVGGERLTRSAAVLRPGGRIVSVAEEADGAFYFVVEPNRDQLAEVGRLADTAGYESRSIRSSPSTTPRRRSLAWPSPARAARSCSCPSAHPFCLPSGTLAAPVSRR